MSFIQHRKYSVTAPYIFRELNSFAPNSLTARDLLAFHQDAYSTVSTTLRNQGAPELKPAHAFACHEAEYREKVRMFASGLDPVLSSIGGLCHRKYTASGIEFEVLYNLDLLASNPQLAGPVAVHEIMSTCLGDYTERLLEYLNGSPKKREGQNTSLSQVDVISEGFAALFSQSPFPFSPRFLLQTEYVLAHDQEYISEADRRFAHRAITDVHCFPAIALLKIEAAYGFEALMGLLRGPGSFDKSSDFGSYNFRDRLMNLYFSANELLADEPIRFEWL